MEKMSKAATQLCLIICCLPLCSSEDPKEVTVRLGEDATLDCHGPRGATIIMLKWSRPDLKSGGHVFYFRDNRSHNDYQHLSFGGRVELRDPQMKDGDFSVILKNVTNNDTGIYECYAGYNPTDKPVLQSNITLKVEDSGLPGGQSKHRRDGVKAALLVATVFLFVAASSFFISKKCRRHRQESQ